jgi:hypothetical protein
MSPEELVKMQAEAEEAKRKAEAKALLDSKLAILNSLSTRPVEEVATGEDKEIAIRLKQAKQKANDEYYIAKNHATNAINRARSTSSNTDFMSKKSRQALTAQKESRETKEIAAKAEAKMIEAKSLKDIADRNYAIFCSEYKAKIQNEILILSQNPNP